MRINKNGKGVSFNDRELAGKVRTLALNHLDRILQTNYKDKKFQKEVLLRLASSLLPKLNEHTGADGLPLILPAQLIDKNDTPLDPISSSPRQTPV